VLNISTLNIVPLRNPNGHPHQIPGQALRWWLDQLSRDTTREALLNRQLRF
jgi:hypothetical protein